MADGPQHALPRRGPAQAGSTSPGPLSGARGDWASPRVGRPGSGGRRAGPSPLELALQRLGVSVQSAARHHQRSPARTSRGQPTIRGAGESPPPTRGLPGWGVNPRRRSPFIGCRGGSSFVPCGQHGQPPEQGGRLRSVKRCTGSARARRVPKDRSAGIKAQPFLSILGHTTHRISLSRCLLPQA